MEFSLCLQTRLIGREGRMRKAISNGVLAMLSVTTIGVVGTTSAQAQPPQLCQVQNGGLSFGFPAQGGRITIDVPMIGLFGTPCSGQTPITTLGTIPWTSTSFWASTVSLIQDPTDVQRIYGTGSVLWHWTIQAGPNTTGVARLGYASAAGNAGGSLYYLNQGVPICTYSVNPNSVSFGPSGGAGVLDVMATPNSPSVPVSACTWTAGSLASWITGIAPTSNSGNGTVSFNVAVNTGAAYRTGLISVAGQTVPVTQSISALQITTGSLPPAESGSEGQYKAVVLQASGGTPPYVWSATGLPPGFEVTSPGTLRWTGPFTLSPVFPQTFDVVLKVTDSTGLYNTKPVDLFVAEPLKITSPFFLPKAHVGHFYTDNAPIFKLTANGGIPYTETHTSPYTWDACSPVQADINIEFDGGIDGEAKAASDVFSSLAGPFAFLAELPATISKIVSYINPLMCVKATDSAGYTAKRWVFLTVTDEPFVDYKAPSEASHLYDLSTTYAAGAASFCVAKDVAGAGTPAGEVAKTLCDGLSDAAAEFFLDAVDPADANYKILVHTFQPSVVPTGDTVTAINVLLQNMARLGSGMSTSVNRAQGAFEADDSESEAAQLMNAKVFAMQLAQQMDSAQQLSSKIPSAFEALGLSGLEISPEQLATFQSNISASGPSESLLSAFNEANIATDNQALALTLFVTMPTDTVSADLTTRLVTVLSGPTVAQAASALKMFSADRNNDLSVDCSDLSIIRASLGKRTGQPGFDVRADVNGDGIIDIRDLAFVAQQMPTGTHCQ